MIGIDTHAYSLNFRHFEQSVTWSRSSGVSGAGGAGPDRGKGAVESGAALFSVTSRTQEFRLDVLQLSDSQTENQAAVSDRLAEKLAEHGVDLNLFSHEGRSILDLSPAEAQELVAEDGYWGVNQTSERLAGFVLNGAGDNLEMLRAGREGISRGYQEAEKIWGGQLPEISGKTLGKSLAAIDERIHRLGGTIVDRTV